MSSIVYLRLMCKGLAFELNAPILAVSNEFGAQEGTRTPTTLRSPAPEAGASTNFATWAWLYYRGVGIFQPFQLNLAFSLQTWWFDTVALINNKNSNMRHVLPKELKA
jgi:hypothetical protein